MRWIAVALAALLAMGTSLACRSAQDSVILITLDGARIQEMFGGLDVDALRSTLRKDAAIEANATYKRYYADTPEARRRKLMPFLWDVLMTQHGSIAGNPRVGSAVRLTNRHRFSYPGYSEILTGEADDEVINSNNRVRNPHVTVLEGLKQHLNLPAFGAAVFASWENFNEIAEHVPGTLTVNAGYEAVDQGSPAVRELSRLQFETPTPWNEVRHDAYTFGLAMSHLQTARPRVMYLAFGETDDWAHDGRYDRMLEAYTRTDGYIRDLWTWLQSQADYRDRTHILITTDHGRGRSVDDWRDHGEKIAGAEETWMAFISPRLAPRGEWRNHPPLFTNQAAATMAAWVGLKWNAAHAAAGSPVLLPGKWTGG